MYTIVYNCTRGDKIVYTTNEVTKKLGLTKDALRYYEKEGLLPPIERNKNGHRMYSESDIEWIYLIRCLRDTDMKISNIKQYVELLINGGDDSVSKRRSILSEHEIYLRDKINSYQYLLKLIEKKVEFYDEALSSGSPENTKCVDYSTEWDHFRTILGGIEYD